MRNYTKFKGKLIRMNKQYPIYSREYKKEDEVIGYTEIGDMAVITYVGTEKEGYFETVIVSGKYIGVDSLALDFKDIVDSTFIFNKIDGEMDTYIQGKKINFEYV